MERKFYRHFKGGIYELVGYGKDHQSEEELVMYKSLLTGETWVRPKSQFIGDFLETYGIQRFTEMNQLEVIDNLSQLNQHLNEENLSLEGFIRDLKSQIPREKPKKITSTITNNHKESDNRTIAEQIKPTY